ncbi:MAG: DUF4166 domain-containing protein [Burkholderiales bacterium]|nr:DUF4166 domain-containing protein [Burkholderiales bacterium]
MNRSIPSPAVLGAPRPLDLSALVGTAGWQRLPGAVRRRFGAGHGAATYVGRMTLRCSRAGRVFAALAGAFGSPLSAAMDDAVPTSVRVFDDGRGGMVWERSFHMHDGGAPRVVRSTKELDAGGRLVERTDGGLSMGLRVFEERGALVFESHRFFLVLGRLRLPVPALLTPGTCRVVHTDLGDGLFRFDLDMVHPLWGRTFHQSGVFADPVAAAEGSAR